MSQCLMQGNEKVRPEVRSETPISFLLVDDLEENLLALEAILKRGELQLLKAHSGPEALELLLVHDVALAILDVQMPGMSGFELAELMRGSLRTRNVPIIFVTAGFQDHHGRFRGYELGAVDFLYKPIDPHILKSKAEVFFELARKRNELQAIADENARLLKERTDAQQELRRHAENLENMVQERTSRLQETVHELEQYSYSISHDMRAPLRAMNQYSHFVLEEFGSLLPLEGQNYLSRVCAAASRLDRLISDVLTYHRMVRGDMRLERVDLDRLVQDIVREYPMIQASEAEVKVASPLAPVRANLAAITQCLSNLIGNAVKFVPENRKPQVTVRTEPRNGFVRIWVEDNGIGIDPSSLNRVWGIFQQAHADKKYQGTGIGLSIVKKAVERMGGKVGVESEPGQGSRFWFELAASPV